MASRHSYMSAGGQAWTIWEEGEARGLCDPRSSSHGDVAAASASPVSSGGLPTLEFLERLKMEKKKPIWIQTGPKRIAQQRVSWSL